MAVERFTVPRILSYTRLVITALLIGAAIGVIASAIIGFGVQYLGPLEGYRLGGLVGIFIGGVYGGASGMGVRGAIIGVLIGLVVGAGIGNAAWNAQLAGVQNPGTSYDIVHFPAIPIDKVLVIGVLTGATVGGVVGTLPADARR